MADEKKSALLSEKEELELEKLRDEVLRLRALKEQKKAAHADNEKALREGEAKLAVMQGGCNHKKGGRDYAATAKRGDGENYAIFPWIDPLGRHIIICSRCLFVWEPGVTEQFLKDKKTPNPTKISWAVATHFPTDNTPASSVLFGYRPQVNSEAA